VTDIIPYSQAEIEKIGSAAEAANVAQVAKMAHEFYQAKDNQVLAQRAKEIYMRSARRAGQLLLEVEREQGKRTDLTSIEFKRSSYQEALEGAGITTYIANQWQKLAGIPQDKFDGYMTDPKHEWTEYTIPGLLRYAKDNPDEEPTKCTCPECGRVHNRKE